MALELFNNPLVSTENLQGYWRLESNGADSSPNGYTLTTGAGPAYVAGKFGNGADFEASSSQYLEIAGASSGNLNITGNQTWAAWVKVESLATNGRVFGKKKNAKEFVVDSSGALLFQHAGLSAANISTTTTLGTGAWYHIAFRYDGAKSSIWINGVKDKEIAATGSMTSYTTNFALGRNPDTPSDYFDGIIDDAWVFNRALSDAEMQQLYFAGGSKVMFIS